MTAGHDLQRRDAPLPELDAYLRVVACAAALVRTAEDGTVDPAILRRLGAALEAAGIDVGVAT